MIEYTYLEIFLFCAFFVALGFALKYREESIMGKQVIIAMIEDQSIFNRMKDNHDATTKELENAD
jgi:hypothetical protein